MCVKLPPGDLNPYPCPHTSQAHILMEWSLHQGCAVVIRIKDWMREKKESQLCFKDGKGKKKIFFNGILQLMSNKKVIKDKKKIHIKNR